MIIIHAYLKVAAEHRDAFLQQAKAVVAGSNAEEGNISYRLYEDAEEPNAFVMVEKWKDQQAIEVHEKTPHFLGFVSGIQGMLAGPLQAEFFDAEERKRG